VAIFKNPFHISKLLYWLESCHHLLPLTSLEVVGVKACEQNKQLQIKSPLILLGLALQVATQLVATPQVAF
jgi:hypothetical protein